MTRVMPWMEKEVFLSKITKLLDDDAKYSTIIPEKATSANI